MARTVLRKKKVHFVGIGGMGVSALARLFVGLGAQVSGTDRNVTRGTEALEKLGVPIVIGPYSAKQLPADTELVVYTKDEENRNPEIELARQRGIETRSYPQAIPIALQGHQIVGVAGTHGKTTTTGMLGSALMDAGKDPTVVVGSWFSKFGGNARLGTGTHAVVEADEYKRAFLNYRPTIAIVTNVEADHLNYYKDIEDIRLAFRDFLRQLPPDGLAVVCTDDPGARTVAEHLDVPVLWYGLGPQAELSAKKIKLSGPTTHFEAHYQGKLLGAFSLLVPGEHNVRNALAVIGVLNFLKVPVTSMQKSLAAFPGAWRRFEFKGEVRGVTVIDDYAHHPTELQATLLAARARFGSRRIVAIFQPHFYGRLRDFFDAFAKALTLADRVVIPPVYAVAGRENDSTIRTTFNNRTLAAAVTKLGSEALAVESFDEALAASAGVAQTGDVLMTIGAGDVTELAPRVLTALQKA